MENVKNHWAEVVCDYIDEQDGFWRVDAWKSDANGEPNEEGEVIAIIDSVTSRIYYNDPVARVDHMAQEVIQAKVREIREELSDMQDSIQYFKDITERACMEAGHPLAWAE